MVTESAASAWPARGGGAGGDRRKRPVGISGHEPPEYAHCQPHRLDPDQRSSSRKQAAQSVAADAGQRIVSAVGPRRSSMRVSPVFPAATG
jgi:hypothetical protein